MTDRRHVLTPDALQMVDTIARTGSFASAAREMGKVPSALTYSVRQLEDALDVLLFDRRSRQARLTAAGEELLHEGRRLLLQMDAVANRVQRVASGWETQLSIAVDGIISPAPLFDLIEAFSELQAPTRLKLRTEVLSGTWETLMSGHADLALGINAAAAAGTDVQTASLGSVEFIFVVAPFHRLAAEVTPVPSDDLLNHRIVAVADSARRLESITVGILPGQDVLTVSSMADKQEALRRGLGCGFMPRYMVDADLQAGRLVHRPVDQPARLTDIHYGWRAGNGTSGKALRWWLDKLSNATTREALLTLPCQAP